MPRGNVVLRAVAAASLAASSVRALACVQFDASYNLYAFGYGAQDYSLGAQDSWASGSATALPSAGRPPYTGQNMQCFISQYQNSIYILDADAANPTDVYIFNAAGSGSWSTQKTNANGADLTKIVSILDHDTNVFFGLSGGTLYQADFGALTKANSTAIDWQSVESPSFTATNYNPTMALAQNHIHFIGVPGAGAGVAYLFVIHFAYFQPTSQTYTAIDGGSAFPSSHGSTASFLLDSAWQEQFAFIPDDCSKTYVTDVQTNTTVDMAGPSGSCGGATYAASETALVQLTSTGTLAYITYNQKDQGGNTGNKWASISVSGLGSFTGGGGGGNSGNSTSSTGAPSGTAPAPSGTGSSSKIATVTNKPSGTGSPSGSGAPASTTSTKSGAGRSAVISVGALVLGLVPLAFLL